MAWLDIDHFKRINDTAGFAAGDDLIRAIGRALTDHARRLGDVTVGHVGGDDFLVVCGVEDITSLADAVIGHGWSADGVPVTLSLASRVQAGASAGSYRESARLLAPLKKQPRNPGIELDQQLAGRRTGTGSRRRQGYERPVADAAFPAVVGDLLAGHRDPLRWQRTQRPAAGPAFPAMVRIQLARHRGRASTPGKEPKRPAALPSRQ